MQETEKESVAPTHVFGSEVTGVGSPDANGICDVACKDGKSYKWNQKTGEIHLRKD